MIPIDTVYQRVLALANKEQRGYITPLEFNLLANQAQEIVFEQYFYDLNQAKRDDSDITSFSDMEELIQNKLAPFKSVQNVIGNTNFPTNYRTGKIFANGFEVDKVTSKEFMNIMNSNFHGSGLAKNPIYRDSVLSGSDIEVYAGPNLIPNVTVEVIQKPSKAEWGYDVIAEKALYNASRSTNFELHESEESELVYKILTLTGVTIKKIDLQQSGQGLDMAKINQEKV